MLGSRCGDKGHSWPSLPGAAGQVFPTGCALCLQGAGSEAETRLLLLQVLGAGGGG